MGVAPRKRTEKPAAGRPDMGLDAKGLTEAASSIRTPIALISLVVLVCGVVLAYQAARQDTKGGIWLAAGAFLIMVLAVVGGIVLARDANKTPSRAVAALLRPAGLQKTFMSAPMASLTGENYVRMKEKIRAIKEALKRDAAQADVFWGGDSVEDAAHWDRPAEALRLTIERIRDCDNFILVLPDYACSPHAEGFCKPSSIWWEAGIAVAFGKRCTFFIHEALSSTDRMPYYLRAMETTAGEGIPASRLWRFRDLKDIERDIREARGGIFGSI